jgi:hypothetical protein
MVGLYLHSPICLYDMMLNYILKYTDTFFFVRLLALRPLLAYTDAFTFYSYGTSMECGQFVSSIHRPYKYLLLQNTNKYILVK